MDSSILYNDLCVEEHVSDIESKWSRVEDEKLNIGTDDEVDEAH